ncbi:hypothetical protein BC629DRAFT_1573670 [Irpex lacteus]|nr:hypothetical protein BC629DRAFT_1573670 [Irpex lacteus]
MQPSTTQNVNAALPAALDSLLIGDTTGHTKRKTTTGELPNELWDIIIGQYFRDSDSILTQRHRIACSLVCREWRSIALSHLFRRIRIPTPKRDVAAYLHSYRVYRNRYYRFG